MAPKDYLTTCILASWSKGFICVPGTVIPHIIVAWPLGLPEGDFKPGTIIYNLLENLTCMVWAMGHSLQSLAPNLKVSYESFSLNQFFAH